MSDELYTQEEIVNHLENCSPTKFMYSFLNQNVFGNLIKGENQIIFIIYHQC